MLRRVFKIGKNFPPAGSRHFSRLSDKDVAQFEKILGSKNVKTQELDDYNADWSKWYKGASTCVVFPTATEEVSRLLAYCSQKKLAVVPQSGNTGLVGGSIPINDEIIISMKKLNQHFEYDQDSGVMTCDSGFILEELDNKLGQYGAMMPFDIGAKGSCLIGGNIATCAGGIRLLRYGSLHAHLMGVTVVLPDDKGTIYKCGGRIRKDNTSLHTHHLFLGSEGQLGIITSVTMSTAPRPKSIQSVMLGTDSFENCLKILSTARKQLGEILSSFEFMDRPVMESLEVNLQLENVLKSQPEFNLLIETSGSNESHDTAKVEAFLENCLSENLAQDGVMANSAKESFQMWQLRESAPLAVARDGYVYKHDVSLPQKHFYELSEVMKKRCEGLAKRVVTYGHLGDGNSHLNITSDGFNQELYDRLYPELYEWVVRHGGSISAEHGIGQMKLQYSKLIRSPEDREIIKKLKKTFDPNGILNPNKFL